MNPRATVHSLWLGCLMLGLLMWPSAPGAEADDERRKEVASWIDRAARPISDAGLEGPVTDLHPLRNMIGEARIVGISEAVHAATEPMLFRNRVFRYLVEEVGFEAIAIESGLVESRVVNDYVVHGKGEFEDVMKHGFANGFHTFRQNRELVRWLREHNARLPAGARKVQFFGLDVPGSPGNFDAVRRPDHALTLTLEYLSRVDADSAAQLSPRIEPFLPALKGTNGYADLKQPDRDKLTAAIADAVSLIERHRIDYVQSSSAEDYDWALQTAIGARQVDAWFRRMPIGWKIRDGFAWTVEAMRIRDRSMADNLEWILHRLTPGGRVVVFGAVGHIAATRTQQVETARDMEPFGTYVKARHGAAYVNILNLVAEGEIQYCSRSPRTKMPLKPAPAASINTLFKLPEHPRYVIDLRTSPGPVAHYLQQPRDHWNGFGQDRFPTAKAFDIAFYVQPVASDCVPEH